MSKALQVVRGEVRELIPPAVFFLVLFHMLAMTQAVARGQQGVTLLRSLAATIGALTVAKAILLVNALPHVRALGGFAAAHRHAMAETSPARILVIQMWLWAAVLLYTTTSELVRRYGWTRVKDELLHREVMATTLE
jgi:hypothetical protein